MIHKIFVVADGKLCARVDFTLPEHTWAGAIYLVGDFNAWHRTSHPFRHESDGKWTISVDLEVGRAYQFRYLIDDRDWINDSQADAYVYNPYGSNNFVVVTDPQFKQYRQ